MFERKYVIAAIAVTILIFGLLAYGIAKADPEVKYCKDMRTGEIFVVEAGYPCPGTTVEI